MKLGTNDIGSVYLGSNAVQKVYLGTNEVWSSFSGGLLDTYSGAAAAYSLRRLSSSYTGSAIRVRRSVGSPSEIDIGFSGEDLDVAALESFCSATDGFVTTWYDQSGNGNNATQITSANQPQIVTSGNVIQENNKPSLFFDQSIINFFTLSSNIAAQNIYSCFAVAFANQTNTGADMLIAGGVGSYGFRLTGSATLPRITITKVSVADLVSPVISANKQTLGTFLTNDIQVEVLTDGVSRGTASINTPTNPINTIGRAGNGGQDYQGNFQELILYTSDESSNRSGIETNINDFYSIY
jgi:hypothetical protein